MKYKILFIIAFSLNFGCEECSKCPPRPECPECPERPECSVVKLPVLIGVEEISTKDTMNSANVGIKENISIDSLDGNYNLKATIFCDTQGNNDAHNIEVMVSLPAEVQLISYSGPDSCLILSDTTTFTNKKITVGFVKFTKRSMSRTESFDIKVTTSKPIKPDASRPNFSIYVHNISPEINYKDNFWSWK